MQSSILRVMRNDFYEIHGSTKMQSWQDLEWLVVLCQATALSPLLTVVAQFLLRHMERDVRASQQKRPTRSVPEEWSWSEDSPAAKDKDHSCRMIMHWTKT